MYIHEISVGREKKVSFWKNDQVFLSVFLKLLNQNTLEEGSVFLKVYNFFTPVINWAKNITPLSTWPH